MTAAPTYNRQFNFTNFQALSPATPLPGINVDIELSSIKVTLDALIANAALIQRSDGQLANASVGQQQLQPSILAGMNPPKQWSGAGVSYNPGDTVFAGFLFYSCITANVSTAANPPATFGAWVFIADFSGITIPANSITSAAFAPGAVNSAALGAGLALPASPATGDSSTAIATTAFVSAELSSVLSGFKNRLINPAMSVDQRNGGAAGTSVGYTIDRWKYGSTQTSKAQWQQQSATPPAGFAFYLNMFTTATYTIASTDVSNIAQVIEANDVYDLQWGTASAAAVTLSFWVKTLQSGAYGGSIRNGASTRSFPFLFSGVANSWNFVSITIPGDTGGTWANGGTAAGLIVSFCLGTGSTFLGTANAWQAGNFVGAVGSSQIIGAAGNGVAITGVSFQAGPGVSEFRPFAQELLLCQRYFEQQSGDGFQFNVTSGSAYFKYTSFFARKRATPAMVYSSITASNFSGGISTSAPSPTGIKWGSTANATGVGALGTTWTADADF